MRDSHTKGIAFVLMKFQGDPWNDPIYECLSEVLAEAGYEPLRADEMRTSGPVVEEVCRLMRNAPLLVIDTSGDSQSVSYELGYAHGAGRPHESTIVLRSHASGASPFNYAHFRMLPYRDRRHLRRALRSRLRLSTPLRDDDVGFAFNFSVLPNAGEYGGGVARAILAALMDVQFSGRCEYYAGEMFVPGDSFYVVGLGLKTEKGLVPKYAWWHRLKDFVCEQLPKFGTRVRFNADLSEPGEMRALRAHYMPRGVAEFAEGKVDLVLGGEVDDSWFLAECKKQAAPTKSAAQNTG